MKYLVIALLSCAIILGIGFVIDVSGMSVVHKFILTIFISVPFAILVLKLSKRMSRLESAVFVVVLIATLAISWTLRDIERGVISLYTILALFAFAGGVLQVVYLLARRRMSG